MAAKNKVTNPSPEGALLGTTFGRALLGLLPGAGPWIGLRGDSKEKRKIGDLDDGGVYVGKSATTGQDLHAAPADEPEYLTFDEAFEAAAQMSKQPGRQNAHVPTPEELNENLFDNRNKGALRGTFNTSGSYPASCYRSSTSYGPCYPRVQWFDNGYQDTSDKGLRMPVRLVW